MSETSDINELGDFILNKLVGGLICGTLLSLNVVESLATVIDVPSTGGDYQAFGESEWRPGRFHSSAWGQTFHLEAGDGQYLESISFSLLDYTFDDSNINFTFHIYEWDGIKIVGDSIFSTGVLSTDDSGEKNVYNLDLSYAQIDLGTEYMWLLNVSHDGVEGAGGVFDSYDGEYANGSFYTFLNDGNLNSLFTNGWQEVCPSGCRDLAFTLNTVDASPVPLPQSALLFLSGILSLLGLPRKSDKCGE